MRFQILYALIVAAALSCTANGKQKAKLSYKDFDAAMTFHGLSGDNPEQQYKDFTKEFWANLGKNNKENYVLCDLRPEPQTDRDPKYVDGPMHKDRLLNRIRNKVGMGAYDFVGRHFGSVQASVESDYACFTITAKAKMARKIAGRAKSPSACSQHVHKCLIQPLFPALKMHADTLGSVKQVIDNGFPEATVTVKVSPLGWKKHGNENEDVNISQMNKFAAQLIENYTNFWEKQTYAECRRLIANTLPSYEMVETKCPRPLTAKVAEVVESKRQGVRDDVLKFQFKNEGLSEEGFAEALVGVAAYLAHRTSIERVAMI